MAHPELIKPPDRQFADIWLADEANVPVLVCLVQAAFSVAQGALRVEIDAPAINVAGETWGPPEVSSIKYEPQFAFTKLSTDVVLIAAGQTPQPTVTLDVGLRVGPLQKIVRVFGDRYWVKTGGQIFATKPQPFTRMPLVYERAFGGWDRAHKDEGKWTFDKRNPVGRGYGDPLRFVEEGKVLLPNIEDPNHLIKRYGDTPPPAGVGFISPNWQPRVQYAGTYDAAWEKDRKPLLPVDFDRRFFNGASPGLIATAYLKGDEEVAVVNAAPVTPLRFRLPGVPPPACRIGLRNGTTELVRTNLDTLIVNTDEMRLLLLWRGYLAVPRGPHDVAKIEVGPEEELRQTAVVAENDDDIDSDDA